MSGFGGTLWNGSIFIDSSAVIALVDPTDQYHTPATAYFESLTGSIVASMDATAHETFTRLRKKRGGRLARALAGFDRLRDGTITFVPFTPGDEVEARRILAKHDDQILSFHDALCAAVMLRKGAFRIFAFDSDFRILGFETLP